MSCVRPISRRMPVSSAAALTLPRQPHFYSVEVRPRRYSPNCKNTLQDHTELAMCSRSHCCAASRWTRSCESIAISKPGKSTQSERSALEPGDGGTSGLGHSFLDGERVPAGAFSPFHRRHRTRPATRRGDTSWMHLMLLHDDFLSSSAA
jgi:hypothetical protein